MTGEVLTVHLKDEMPRIGSGVRRVRVRTLGWKWVTVDACHGDGMARISRTLWDTIKQRKDICSEPLPAPTR